IPFMVNFDPSQDKDDKTRIDKVWGKLSAGGNILMPLDKYPFSERYGWIQDRYGLTWQLILTNPAGDPRPAIVPSLMFGGDKAGQAEAAIRYYTSVFPDSRAATMVRY